MYHTDTDLNIKGLRSNYMCMYFMKVLHVYSFNLQRNGIFFEKKNAKPLFI